MLSIILAHAAMLLAFQVVLVLVGLTMVVKIVSQLRTSKQLETLADIVTRPVLLEVFPLILISLLSAVTGAHVIVLIFYYLAALLIVIRSLLELSHAFKQK